MLRAAAQCELSTISIIEIAIKQARGKLAFTAEHVQEGIAGLQLRVLPLAEVHALEFFGLPLMHTDPFDRQLIAQALTEQIPVVTSDESFARYQGLKVIW
jgi:PIN domain nuclease of toxin-antitoxin system